ncbi:hypothetical protein ACLQ29_00175 [Micromonospora sp. DT228]|uniref:hypothetical protein n=1 Tax=Micromonospora sp. DT228 TaxID=3393443 RepID=UPI003CF35EDC
MTGNEDFMDDSIGEMDLTDLEFDDVNGGTHPTVIPVVTLLACTRNTLCGTCGVASVGCC